MCLNDVDYGQLAGAVEDIHNLLSILQNGLKKATKRITLTAATQETRSRFYGKLPRGMIRS